MEGRKFEALYINIDLPLIVGYGLRLSIGISVISRVLLVREMLLVGDN